MGRSTVATKAFLAFRASLYKMFPEPESVGPREWGEEILLVHIPTVLTLKKIIMRAGAEGGLQYHRIKNECGTMVEGQMLIEYMEEGDELRSRTVGPGDSFHFAPYVVHKATAITDCTYIEASTPVFNDRVHVEKCFGREEKGGLPSTTIQEVEVR